MYDESVFHSDKIPEVIRQARLGPIAGLRNSETADEHTGDTIRGVFGQLYEEFTDRRHGFIEAIVSNMQWVCVLACRLLVAPAEDRQLPNRLALEFLKSVQNHFVSERALSFYANELGVSAGHLAKRVKAALGKPPAAVIREMVLLEAKRLLAHTDLTVAEICYRLRFEDPSYFGRFFKRESGISPHRFRGKHTVS